MEEEINARFGQLLEEGKQLEASLPRTGRGSIELSIPITRIAEYESWIASATNLLRLVSPAQSQFIDEAQRALDYDPIKYGLQSQAFQRIYGLLQAAEKEWNAGLLTQIEYLVAAETFDDFLDHASAYHKGGKKIEASVLASAVLEDTVKRIAAKNGLDTIAKSLEELIDDLVKAAVITRVKAKRIKGYAGTRNSALHAEWDDFDLKDVGSQISGLRELIEDFL